MIDGVVVQKIEEVNMIITDFDMPGMNGLELLKKIKVIN